MRPGIVALVLVVVVAAAGGSWLYLSRPPASTPAKPAPEFFGTPQHYDTQGGQEMKPRW